VLQSRFGKLSNKKAGKRGGYISCSFIKRFVNFLLFINGFPPPGLVKNKLFPAFYLRASLKGTEHPLQILVTGKENGCENLMTEEKNRLSKLVT